MKAHLMIRNTEEVSQLFNPTGRHRNKIADICLGCKEKNCKGDCSLLRQERQKLNKQKHKAKSNKKRD